MNYKILGYGSFFHGTNYQALIDDKDIDLLKESRLFYTGRHAIRYLIDEINQTNELNTIWLPNYYCQHVTSWLKKIYHNISFYKIDPFKSNLEFDLTIFKNPNDLVILNNFWGIYSYDIPNSLDRPIFIEDHSHGWLTKSCKNSVADFCFASLRKTLPVPLGGIAWTPKKSGYELSHLQTITNSKKALQEFVVNGWQPMNSAMEIKRDCTDLETKNEYLCLYGKAETYLHQQYEVLPMEIEHENIIKKFMFKDYNSYKSKNLTSLYNQIIKNDKFKIITKPGEISFGLDLAFKSYETLKNLKTFLVGKTIYPSELWPENHIENDFKYLLNVHIDFRYQEKDITYIIIKLNDWIVKNY